MSYVHPVAASRVQMERIAQSVHDILTYRWSPDRRVTSRTASRRAGAWPLSYHWTPIRRVYCSRARPARQAPRNVASCCVIPRQAEIHRRNSICPPTTSGWRVA